MNRTDNLLKALPSWIAHATLSEILIVDWNSDVPVAESLHSAGIYDPRIRIVRVENEPVWILSYAFNVGFRTASYGTILKVDADIVLSADFFTRNQPDPQCFIAGNWRAIEKDQAYLNGFFVLPSRALYDVNGFNEFITTYGWDDDDIYARLVSAGYIRQDVAPDTVFHLPHSDEERIGNTNRLDGLNPTMLELLSEGTELLINTNRFLASMMPYWGRSQILLPFAVVDSKYNCMTLQRNGSVPSEVPAQVLASARKEALTALLSLRFGPLTRDLHPSVMDRLLARPAKEFSLLDIQVGIVAPHAVPDGSGFYLVLDIRDQRIFDDRRLETVTGFLVSLCRQNNISPLVRIEAKQLPPGAPSSLRDLPIIPTRVDIGNLHDWTIAAMRSGQNQHPGNLVLQLDTVTISTTMTVFHKSIDGRTSPFTRQP